MLSINDNSSILDKDSIKVEFIRFEYDVEKAAKAVEDSANKAAVKAKEVPDLI